MRDLPKDLRIVPASAAPVGAVAVTADGRILPARPILATAPAATVDIRDGVLTIDLEENDPDVHVPGIPTVAAASIAPAVTPAARPVLTWEPAPDTPAAPTRGPDPVAAPVLGLDPAVAPTLGPDPVAAPTLRPNPAVAPVLGPDPVAAQFAEPSSAPSPTPLPSPAPAAAVAVEATPTPAAPTQAVAAAPAFVPAAPVETERASLGSMVAASSAPAVQATTAPTEESSVTDLLPAHTTPRPAPIEVPVDARSTAAQRRAMRGRLGSSYDVATRAVTRLLSERPGLRFGAGDRSALLTELAVVRVFADNPGGQYDADFYVCLADGLRRLPTARAVVVRGIPADTDVRPASVIRLPTPMVAAPAKSTAPVGPAEALIWTTTARRLDGLVDGLTDGESRTDDVVLSGHTTLAGAGRGEPAGAAGRGRHGRRRGPDPVACRGGRPGRHAGAGQPVVRPAAGRVRRTP